MASIPDPVMDGLTAARTALESRSDCWLNVMVVATVLVAIGVVIEVWATILEVRDERREGGTIKWHHILTFIGAILVAAFVGLECIAEYKGGSIETALRDNNRQIEQVLIKDASDAEASAQGAESAASRAEASADEAQQKTDAVSKQADVLTLHLGAASKKLDELEARLAWRVLTPKCRSELATKLTPLGGQRIDFFLYPNDPEINGIAEQVASTLPGWQLVGFQPLGGGNVSGMLVEFDPTDNAATTRASMLVSVLGGKTCDFVVHGPIASLPTPPAQLPAMLTGSTPVGATIRLTIGKK
jgi:hypothetical protein